jgi:hypothetical protein
MPVSPLYLFNWREMTAALALGLLPHREPHAGLR